MTSKLKLLCGAAIASLFACAPANAQNSGSAENEGGERTQASDIIVNGAIVFRNRTDLPNPVLSYDLQYFQRFEPVSVGEMLKRVPGVTFTSDVLEYDGVQMRGLPAGFTQVLINGRRAPGGNADRSFFVDRIPAELIERIEIVRSPRADQPSEGVAGTLNIITKESATFEGGFAKAGMLINEDGGVRPSGALAYAGKLGEDTSFWAAVNYQERRNPKKKVSLRFDDETTGPFDETNAVFNNTEFQNDTRDGSDLSGNAEITHEFAGGGRIRIGGFFVDTNRDEDETSLTFEGADMEFDEAETQHEEIGQQTYALTADVVVPLGGLELGLAGGWNGYRENTDVSVSEAGEEDLSDLELVETEALDINDDEYTGTISLTYGKDTPLRVKAGIDLLHKTREGSDLVFNVEDDELEDLDPSVNFRIKEDRYDPYVRLTYEPSNALSIDAGLRYEITRRKAESAGVTTSYDAELLNPSLHLRYALSPVDQFRASVARTVRRPDYDLISPYERQESPGDDDVTLGNPALKNERAWGVDVGYERSLGERGILGVNFFYRHIKDLTELVATGEDVIDDNDTPDDASDDEVIGSVYTPQNIGDGDVWGVEVDFSAPLTAFGLPNTGIFANYTYLDSETTDPFTLEKRRFNNQPHHVYNVGFIQTVPSVNASFGATISGRSKALESNFDETVELEYTPDLEAFVEKRIGKHFVLRGSVQNLLNRKKKETFRKFDGDNFQEILDARAAGDIDEFELEREQSGRLFQVTLRAAF